MTKPLTLKVIQQLFEEVSGITFYQKRIKKAGKNILIYDIWSVEELSRLLDGIKNKKIHIFVSDPEVVKSLEKKVTTSKNEVFKNNDILVINTSCLDEWNPSTSFAAVIAPLGLPSVTTYGKLESLLTWTQRHLHPRGFFIFEQRVLSSNSDQATLHFKGMRTLSNGKVITKIETIRPVMDSSHESITLKEKRERHPATFNRFTWYEVYGDDGVLEQKFFDYQVESFFFIDEIMELASTKFQQVIFLGNYETEELYQDGDELLITVLGHPLQ